MIDILRRLGQMLYVLGCILGTVFVGVAVLVFFSNGAVPDGDGWFFIVLFLVLAVASWLIGKGIRYVLCGPDINAAVDDVKRLIASGD
jgi:hypothetical protein